MKRIKDFLRFALYLAAICLFIFLVMAVFFWAFGPFMAACFDFTEDWTLEEKMQLWEAIRNPY